MMIYRSKKYGLHSLDNITNDDLLTISLYMVSPKKIVDRLIEYYLVGTSSLQQATTALYSDLIKESEQRILDRIHKKMEQKRKYVIKDETEYCKQRRTKRTTR